MEQRTPSSIADGLVGAAPAPAIDPELAVALEALPAFPPLTVELLPLLRESGAANEPDNDDFSRGGAFEVFEDSAPGIGGAPDVPLLICLPTSGRTAGCVVYFHGGGMMLGTERSGLMGMLQYAQSADLAVISVRYRLSPETRHPGPVLDCFAGVSWAANESERLGYRRDAIIVAGASAGGGLAAATVLMARDEGRPTIAGQMLIAPMLDHRNNSKSVLQLQGAGTWNREVNKLAWSSFLGPIGDEQVSPYASPARANNLEGLPPTYVDTGGADAFRDEDVDYALRMGQAGNLVELHVWPGAYHGFEEITPDAAVTREAIRARATWLRLLATRLPQVTP